MNLPQLRGKVTTALVTLLLLQAGPAIAQESVARPDSVPAQIRTTLRAFYFDLAHQDWEALTAQILPAKVMAHRPAPEAFVVAAGSHHHEAEPSSSNGNHLACAPRATALVDQAVIALDGDWAEVSVPRCTPAAIGTDEFRLIRFEEHWRLIYIDLFQEPWDLFTVR